MLSFGHSKGGKLARQMTRRFLAIGLIPLGLVTYVTYRYAEDALRREVTNGLFAIAKRQSNQIETYLREREKDAAALARGFTIVAAAEQYDRAFRAGGPNSQEYLKVDSAFRPFITHLQQSFGYADLFLISLEGNAIFSAQRGKELGTNFRHGPFRNSELAKVFERAIMMMATDLSDFARYAPKDAPAAFIATPVMRDRSLIGILALQMDNEAVYRVVNEYTGLGATGETIIGSRVGQ